MTNYTISSNLDITNLQLSDGAYRCYMLLQSLSYGDKTTCYPSEKYLAHALGRCVRTIQRYITELIDLKLIIKRRRGSISNLYTLVQKTVNNAVDRLKRAVKGKREPERRTLKDKEQVTNHEADKQTLRTKKTYYPKNYKKKTEHFNDYTQRQYDFNKLENALLGTQKVTEFSDLLLE